MLGFMNEDFKGDVKHIKHERLINIKKQDDVQNFFLTLSVIFNDLKGLIIFQRSIEENYRLPDPDEVSAHAGECAGIIVQVHKLIVATVNEFFLFLKENESVLDKTEFALILQDLPVKMRSAWNDMVDVALGQNPNATDFAKVLVQIRNNTAFHYYRAGKNLRAAYITRFSNNTDLERNKYAYYSIGDTMESTRFYYADAALEQYLFTTANKMIGIGHDKEIVFNAKYNKFIAGTVETMNFAIRTLLKIYIRKS
jgi:hypothetical protein